MNNSRSTSRWALWVFVAALFLRAAMPLLANASAEAQGKTMVEVCSVYGVSMVPLDGSEHHRPAQGSMPDHGSEHCALAALAALAAPSLPVFADAPVPSLPTGPPRARPSHQSPDACAAWRARLKHGPPDIA